MTANLPIALCFALCFTLACDEPASDTPAVPLEIVGEYIDPFGVYHLIDAAQWIWGEASAPQRFEVVEFNNEAQWILARNSPENLDAPARFSRFDWQLEDHRLRYCHTVTGATTVGAAATASPDQCAPGDWVALERVDEERVEDP